MLVGYDGYSNNQHISQRTIWAIGLFLVLWTSVQRTYGIVLCPPCAVRRPPLAMYRETGWMDFYETWWAYTLG